MLGLELACAAIVAVYLAHRLRARAERGAVLRRLGLLVAASWLGEDSVIRAYGFYHYAHGWHGFVDEVPILIVLIWPVVIDSSWQLARRLTVGDRVPLLAAAFVLADASLIEPIAVRASLWSWTAPGLFSVPPVGILGWALFAVAAVALIPRAGVFTIVLAPLATHALLLLSWWGGLRALDRHVGHLPSWGGVAVAWALLLPLTLYAWRRRLRFRVPLAELAVRIPGALFFFVLLALHARGALPLVCYALAFVPPYLALCAIH